MENKWEKSDGEALAEYAARVCYNSTHAMGRSPNFIQQRLKEGHEDVIEHATFTVEFEDEPLVYGEAMQRYGRVDGKTITANARVWRQAFQKGVLLSALPLLKAEAPAFFGDL